MNVGQLHRDIQLGLGLYPTHDQGFNPHDFADNKFSPTDLTESVRLALKYTDRYVWIWNQAASYWRKGGPSGKPLLADQPMSKPVPAGQMLDPAFLTTPATFENVIRERYYGVPQAYIDAITIGKARALGQY